MRQSTASRDHSIACGIVSEGSTFFGRCSLIHPGNLLVVPEKVYRINRIQVSPSTIFSLRVIIGLSSPFKLLYLQDVDSRRLSTENRLFLSLHQVLSGSNFGK